MGVYKLSDTILWLHDHIPVFEPLGEISFFFPFLI